MDLTFLTPLNRLGYGVTGVNMSTALIESGVDLTIVPIGPVDLEQKYDYLKPHIFGAGDRGYNPTAMQVRNFHEYDMQFLPGLNKKAGWPFFELDFVVARGVQMLNSLDCVLAGSDWAEETLRKNHVTVDIEIVPQGVDTSLFKNETVHRSSDEYRFFSIGKWEERKGHPDLVRSFIKAFPDERDVRLYLMCNNPFLKSGLVEQEIAKLSNNDPRVVFVSPVSTHAEVVEFINGCDCGVFPTRGEGFGLSLLECLSCGKPMLSTFVTAHASYLDSEVATEITTKGMSVANDGRFFRGQGRWYNPDPDSIVEGMRKMYEAKTSDNPEGRERAEEYSWKNSATKLIEVAKKYS